MKKSILALAVSAITLQGCSSVMQATPPQLSPASSAHLSKQCEALGQSLSYEHLTIKAVSTIQSGELRLAGQDVAEHCLVIGEMYPRTSEIDGQRYAIGFEMRLPKSWNGRFLYQANGGLDGKVKTALGDTGGGPTTSALSKGFAVISSDAGHSKPLPTFGYDPQARLDYGYQAVAKLTPMAKSILQQSYGKQPDRSYFAGCSNGGRHAMVAAARYGDQYDGILVGAPGYRLPLAATASIAGAQTYASIPGTDRNNLESAFTKQERLMVINTILKKCDALDGLEDGLVQDYRSCQTAFSLQNDIPTCESGRDGSCLTTDQKTAIGKIFSGVTTSDGKVFYASFPYDTGIASDGHISWEYNAPLQRDSGAVAMIFQTPPVGLKDFNIRNFDGAKFVWQSNIDDLVAKVHAITEQYTESGMGFMAPPSPTSLDTLRDRGGKIMVYHGVSDAIFSVDDTQTWYDQLNENNQGHANQFAQFYPIPGMGHCRGGSSTDQFDMLTPLVNWVEKGQQPEQVIASARGKNNPGGANEELPESFPEDLERPLCPYPTVAKYNGKGDTNLAASFSCK
ncbi:tannase/feruloyl esterase family alpha/beta hydrolase [Marinomonas fungiae]|uniref:tannase/feruloyl esterase family alpha/beta hydrolase n=1 Tax=Marinomonas fungiae TaxID=1137284 RepID=UPI003A945B82